MAKAKEQPIYFVPVTSPHFSNFDELFNDYEEQKTNEFHINVHLAMLQEMDVGGVQQLIYALQYKPHLIEKMLFSLKIQVTEWEDSNHYLPLTNREYLTPYCRWIYELNSFPPMIFFLADEQSRFFALSGDMVTNENQPLKGYVDEEGILRYFIGDEQLSIVVKRLFNCCWFLMVLCYGSGFNPRKYIEALLADVELPLSYEEVYAKFKASLKKGIHFKNIVK